MPEPPLQGDYPLVASNPGLTTWAVRTGPSGRGRGARAVSPKNGAIQLYPLKKIRHRTRKPGKYFFAPDRRRAKQDAALVRRPINGHALLFRVDDPDFGDAESEVFMNAFRHF